MTTKTHVGDDRNATDDSQNALPGANIFRGNRRRATSGDGQLDGIETNFNNVVEVAKKRGQREGGDEQGNETVLENCKYK